jgi:hypothetical protein
MQNVHCESCGPGPCTYDRGLKINRISCAVPKIDTASNQDRAFDTKGKRDLRDEATARLIAAHEAEARRRDIPVKKLGKRALAALRAQSVGALVNGQ